MKTPCAFHQGHFIVQFCKCMSCLLPLCQQCIPIHRQQHTSGINQPIQLINIDSAVKQINFAINGQFKYIDAIVLQTINKYRQSDEQHKKLFHQILQHREAMLGSVLSTYEGIFLQLENNAKRRQAWIRDFNQSVIELKEQLNSMVNSLMGQKYLRTVIMWNRMRPNQSIQAITKKAEKKWVVPSFIPCNNEKLINFIKNNTNLKVLQIQGDSGIKKILQTVKILRYGQPSTLQKSPPQSKTPTIILPPTLNTLIIKQNNSVISTNGSFLVANNQHLSPTHNPGNFNSPTRKSSSKKLQVLSSHDFQSKIGFVG